MSEAVTVGVGSEKVFLKFRKFHRKALVLESLFNRVAGLLVCCVNIAVFSFLRFPHRFKELQISSHVFSLFPRFYKFFVHFLVKKICIRQYHVMV